MEIQDMKTDMLSTWDMLIEQGKREGYEIGFAIGYARGKAQMNIKRTLEFTLNLLQYVPQFTDTRIAALVKMKPAYVKKVRSTFSKTEASSIKLFIRQLFKKVPAIEEKGLEKLEKWGLEKWEEFKIAEPMIVNKV